MKSKIILLTAVVLSTVFLSGCGTQTTSNINLQDPEQTQTDDVQNNPTGTSDNSPNPSGNPQPGGRQMDLATAAKTLGVTEDALKSALGMDKVGNPPDKKSP